MISSPNDHANAKPVIREAWIKVHGKEPTAKEALYAQSVAALETGYGRLGQFAEMAKRGLYNWGGVQKSVNPDGTCPPGFALGSDQGKVCFHVYPSDAEAAAKFIWELTVNPNFNRSLVLNAMSGEPNDVAAAMYKAKYYEGKRGTTDDEKINFYANAIRSRAKEIGNALSEMSKQAQQYAEENPKTAGGLVTIVGLLGLGGGYMLWKRKGK